MEMLQQAYDEGVPRQLETLARVVDCLATPVFVVEMDEAGRPRYVLANRLHQSASGIPAEVLIGREPEEILAPEVAARVVERYRRCAATRKTVEYDYPLTDGPVTRWWQTVLTPLQDAASGRSLLIGTSIEITDQKRVEEQLQRSREQLDLAIRGADMGLWDWDVAGGGVYYSPTWQGILGEQEPLSGDIEEWLGRIHPEEAMPAREALAAHLAAPEGRFHHEHRLRRRDGSWVWVSVKGTARRDGEGRPYRMAGVINSITRRKQAEAAREESERRFRTLLEGSLQGILIHHAYRPLFANEAFARIYGYDSVEAVMREENLLHHVPEEERGKAVRQWELALSDPEHRMVLQNRNLTRDGQLVWVEIMGRPVDWMGVTAMQFTIIDITERRRFEEQLLESRDRLQRQAAELARLNRDLDAARREAEQHGEAAQAANRAKSHFLATMSHELRTPLNAILGFAELISQEAFGPVSVPEYREYASDILTSGQHLLELINDILDLAKIEAGRLDLAPEYLHLDEVMESCLRLNRMRAREREIRMDLVVAPGAEQLFADERAVKQIVFNLLSNAIKFTPPGGSVVLRAERNERGEVVIAVEDSGIGISEKDLQRVLRPFEQVDNSYNRGAGGTGLGLALVTSLSALHGGRLEMDSEPGVGTTIRVIFPAEPAVGLRAAS